MQLLKWLSVTDRFYKIYLDKQLAPYGINNSQYMFLIKICRSPGILQDEASYKHELTELFRAKDASCPKGKKMEQRKRLTT